MTPSPYNASSPKQAHRWLVGMLFGALIALVMMMYCAHPMHAATIHQDTIEDAVRSHVEGQMSQYLDKESNDELQIEIIQVPGAPFEFGNKASHTDDPEEHVLPSTFTLETDSILGERFSSQCVVRVTLKDEDGHRRFVGVPVKIKLMRNVRVAKSTINAGQQLKEHQFRIEKRDVSRRLTSSNSIPSTKETIRGYQARLTMNSGTVLESRKMVLPPDVKQNSDVAIILSNGKGMDISVMGVSLGAGRVGDTVRVRYKHRKQKYFTAEIIDKNKVLIRI